MKSILFYLLCLAIINSQEIETNSIKPYFTALIVADIDQSISWYKKVFELEILNHVKNDARGFEQANLKADSFWLELIELNSSIASKTVLKDKSNKTRIQGFFKFGFTINNIEAFLKRLNELGIGQNESILFDKLSGKKMLLIKDPDGNRLQFFSE